MQPAYHRTSYTLSGNVVRGRAPTAADGRAYRFEARNGGVDLFEHARRWAYGLLVSGRDTDVRYANNTFMTTLEGIAVSLRDGAEDGDAGGNRFLGTQREKVRE